VEASKLMEKVPGLRQKIAGKSIPLEKFVARKARKFQSQGRLALPVLELAYLFLGIAHALRAIVVAKMLPEVEKVLQKLDEHGRMDRDRRSTRMAWGIMMISPCALFGGGLFSQYCISDPDVIVKENEDCVQARGHSLRQGRLRDRLRELIEDRPRASSRIPCPLSLTGHCPARATTQLREGNSTSCFLGSLWRLLLTGEGQI